MPNPIAWQRELRHSLGLFRMCFSVVRSDPRLLLLAVANALVTLVLGLTLVAATVGGEATGNELSMREQGLVVLLIAGLRVGSTVSNSVLVVVAIGVLRGQTVELASAIRLVLTRLPVIAVFSLLAVLVDVLTLLVRKYELPTILSPVAVVQGFLSELIDTAWQLATFVALPVIVLERRGPMESLRRSRRLIEGRWGTGVAAVVGLRAAGIGLVFVGALVVALADRVLPGLAGVGTTLLYAYVVVVVVFLAAVGQVYRAAVYIYATEGLQPAGFEEQRLRAAFA